SSSAASDVYKRQTSDTDDGQTDDDSDDTDTDNDDDDTDSNDTDQDQNDNDQDQNDKPDDDRPIEDKPKPREGAYSIVDVNNPNSKNILPLITTQYVKVNRSITVNIETKTNVSDASLYSMTGQIIKHWYLNLDTGFTNLPVNELSDGVYLLHLQTEQGLITKKILVY
ncbi:MAG: T9SS type A sorting domain-containing protein, partial [Dokdonia sp.]|nr:T9SS type A sorting domain-containing protein [Dokdonia sp.]